jgi:hypothetical protein
VAARLEVRDMATSTMHERPPATMIRPWTVTALLVPLAFDAITALPSGLLMMAWRDGSVFGMTAEVLQHSPFQTFFWPGFLLFACVGLLPAAAIYLILRGAPSRLYGLERLVGRRAGWLVAGASGVATITWIVVQVAMLRGIHTLHGVYLFVGLSIVVLALAPSARRWSRLPKG